jgi:hypothetical protein
MESRMILTESEAKFKFCPLLKTQDDKLKLCLVSTCMMWRWADKEQGTGYCGVAVTPLVLQRAGQRAGERRAPREDEE